MKVWLRLLSDFHLDNLWSFTKDRNIRSGTKMNQETDLILHQWVHSTFTCFSIKEIWIPDNQSWIILDEMLGSFKLWKQAWKSWSVGLGREVIIETVWKLFQRLCSVTCFMFVPDASVSQSELLKGIGNLYQLLWTFSQLFLFRQSNVKRVSYGLSERYFEIIYFHIANRNSHSAEWQRGQFSFQSPLHYSVITYNAHK